MADIVQPGSPSGGPINSGSMPQNYDLVIYKGDALRFTITVKDASQVAVDLTGYTAEAQLKTSYSDISPVNFVCTITTPTSGVVSVYLAPATTAALVADTPYIWDFQLTEPAGDVRTYLTGDVTVFPEVTT